MEHLAREFSVGNECWAAIGGQETEAVAIALPERKTGAAEPVALRPCPQGQDCPDGGFASRILDCQEGCGFRGCASCMEIHESEPHADDSATMREMVRGVGHG